MSVYNLRTNGGNTFFITKFDEDFNVESCYNIAPKGFDYSCDCPANNRSVITKPCRHRRMMKVLLPVVDTDQFYAPDTGEFCEMLGDPHREPPMEEPMTAEEIEELPDGTEKDHHHALQDVSEASSITLIEGEMLKQAVGEAPGSPSLIVPAALFAAVEPPEGLEPSDLEPPHKQQSMLPAYRSAPTIRRR